MRVFLTGSQEFEWRWKMSGFLKEKQIDFFDAIDYPREFSSIFKYFRILEGCDGVIACFSRWEPRHLETVLELSYASKLAKGIFVVDDMPHSQSWIHTLPYSLSFSDLEGLQEHLAKALSASQTQLRLRG